MTRRGEGSMSDQDERYIDALLDESGCKPQAGGAPC